MSVKEISCNLWSYLANTRTAKFYVLRKKLLRLIFLNQFCGINFCGWRYFKRYRSQLFSRFLQIKGVIIVKVRKHYFFRKFWGKNFCGRNWTGFAKLSSATCNYCN